MQARAQLQQDVEGGKEEMLRRLSEVVAMLQAGSSSRTDEAVLVVLRSLVHMYRRYKLRTLEVSAKVTVTPPVTPPVTPGVTPGVTTTVTTAVTPAVTGECEGHPDCPSTAADSSDWFHDE